MHAIFLSRFGTNVLVLERLLLVQDALKRMVLTDAWKQWKSRQQQPTKTTADDLEKLIMGQGPGCFWTRAQQAVDLLSPALKMVRALETDLPTSHLVWDLASQVMMRYSLCIKLLTSVLLQSYFVCVQVCLHVDKLTRLYVHLCMQACYI